MTSINTNKITLWLQCGVVASQITQEEVDSIIEAQKIILRLRKKIASNNRNFKVVLYNLGMAKIDWDYLNKQCLEHKA